MYTYICTAGHVVEAPSMGTFDSCTALEPVHVRGEVRGHAPCGCPVVKVPANPIIEAAYRLGGKDAVTAALREYVTSQGDATGAVAFAG
jgi:hypothetical protein